MSSGEEKFDLSPITGKLHNTESFMDSMLDDNTEIIYNAPIPTAEEAAKERKNARQEIGKIIYEGATEQNISPSSGEAMKRTIESVSGLNKPLIAASEIKDLEENPPSAPNKRAVTISVKNDQNMERKVEYLVDAYKANLTLKEANEDMELDAQDDDDLNEFLGEEDYDDNSAEDASLGTKGSNILGQTDGLMATQHDHANWLAYLTMLFESENLVLHPDYQNDLEHTYHDQGLTERDVMMYCLGIKRERNLSIMKQLDGLVERMSACLDSATTIKTGLNTALGRHEEMLDRMFDTLRATPSMSSASVESVAPPPQRRPPVKNQGGRGGGRLSPNQRWEASKEKREEIKKHPQQSPQVGKRGESGSLIIKENPEKDQKPKEVWKKKDQESDLKKNKKKTSLTSEQEQILDLVGIDKEIYLSEKFLPYVEKIMDEATISEIKVMDPANYVSLKKVSMDLIWKDYVADHPEAK
ncbi:TPA_asm: P [Betula betacytorhabdovirus 2]|nr:TPA_asm: P [Betula betacytorhabdovirus 2]